MKIAVINTGGTISSVGNPLAPMTAQAFAEACKKFLDPILQQQFPEIQMTYLTNVPFPQSKSQTLDSANLQPTDWCIMANGILENYAEFDGFVVLHGTDSMDFTGSALPFLLNAFDVDGYGVAVLSKPVIITGAQVPMYCQPDGSPDLTFNFNTDAFQNICGAVASARIGIPEVCVYFQNHLYRGNRVIKTNTNEFKAFSSPNYPMLAEYGVSLTYTKTSWQPGPVHYNVSLDNPTILAHQQAAVAKIMAGIDNFPVMQFNAFPAHYTQSPANAFIADLIDTMVKAGTKGLILESYGAGNFPSGNPDSPAAGAIYQALDAANKSGVIIVDCTQVLAGTVNSSIYSTGAWIPSIGALVPADMTPKAAMAKLMILMTCAVDQNWTRNQVATLLQTNLTGEMTSVNNLDSRTNASLLPGQSITALDGSATLTNDQVRGPLLMGVGTTSPLWSLPTVLSPNDLPGRLEMRNDGNLVFYNRYNKALWATNTDGDYGDSSKLTLTGQYSANAPAKNELRLQVVNYASKTIAKTLYQAANNRFANKY